MMEAETELKNRLDKFHQFSGDANHNEKLPHSTAPSKSFLHETHRGDLADTLQSNSQSRSQDIFHSDNPSTSFQEKLNHSENSTSWNNSSSYGHQNESNHSGDLSNPRYSSSTSVPGRRRSDFGTSHPGGVTYSWSKLNVFADKTNFMGKITKTTHILKDVSGICKGGQLLAIMGASGAGKTTLLNVLTYRALKLRIEGDITVNGQKAEPNQLMGISAYVQQEDLFTRVFTVKEQLHFHAQLRVGRKVTVAERTRRIDSVLTELGMNKCADTIIGAPGRIKGISGGEKKRLAFACELITNPLMLLCDEPTSGLDSFMAQSVMKSMKKITQSGKTVISTIHQPSSEVFAMFDRLLILAEGRVAFIGTVPEAHKFFARLGHPCPDKFNPGDHFIHTMAVRPDKEEECKQFVHSVCDTFRDEEGQELDAEIERAQNEFRKQKSLLAKISKSPYRSTWGNQFSALFRRSALEIRREPAVTAAKIGISAFFSVIFGLIYFGLEDDDIAGVKNITSCLFIFVTNLSFSQLFPVVTVFSAEMPLFLREHWNGLYRADTYFLTRNMLEFPIYLFIPITFISINYYMVGLRSEAEYFFWAMLILTLVGNIAVSYGYMISCMADNYNTALVLSTPLTFPLMLFAGFYMQSDSIPVYLSWLKWLSWFNYGFEALCINQWDGVTNINSKNETVEIGKAVLDQLSFEPENFGRDLWCMFALLIFYRFLAYFLLVLKTIRAKN